MAQEGNKNALNKGEFRNALRRALARKSEKSVAEGLNQVTDKLVEAAVAGEQWAIKEIADRMDGRPAQSVSVGGDEENPLKLVTTIEVVGFESNG